MIRANTFFILLFLVAQLSMVTNASAKAEGSEDYPASIKALVKKAKLPDSSLTLYAELYPSGTSLLSLNSETPKNPASVSKLVTAATALHEFPTDHKFRTELLVEGSIEGNQLKGNLILQGGGDPAFVSESMWKLVNQFVRTGITSISGDIVVDDTAFDSVRFGDSRREKRVDRAYDAPVGAMSFNWNSVNIFVRPGLKVGEPAKVWLDPANEYLTLKASAQTIKGSQSGLSVQRNATEKGDTISVSGSIGLNANEQVIYKSITKPALWSGYNLKAFLLQRGISVKGTIKTGNAGTKAEVVAFEESKNIASLVSDMNKFSNNYVAEMLIKNLAAKNGSPASLSEGVKRLNLYLQKIDLKPPQMVIKSPSGLSNENRMSSKAAVQLLKEIRKDFNIYPEYVVSLPVAGVDGTLKNRFKGSKASGWVRAKTGYLSGSVALAGFGGRKDGQLLLFAFIHNGSGNAWETRKLFDDITENLLLMPAPTEKIK